MPTVSPPDTSTTTSSTTTTTTTTSTTTTSTTTTVTVVGQGECPTGSYLIQVGGLAPGMVPQFVETRAACDSELDLVLPPRHWLTFRLIDSDGNPIGLGALTPAQVSVRQGPKPLTGAAPDDEGFVRLALADGNYELAVITTCDSGLVPMVLPPIVIEGADIDLGDVVLAREEVLRLSGRVTDVAPGSTVVVGASVIKGGRAFCGSSGTSLLGPASAPSLPYEIGILAGEVTVRAETYQADCTPRPGSFLTTVTISGDTILDLPLESAVIASGTFEDPRRQPVAGATVEAMAVGSVEPAARSCGPSDSSGQFQLALFPNRRYRLLVETFLAAAQLPVQMFPQDILAGGADFNLGTITLLDGCILGGTLEDSRGQPIGSGELVTAFAFTQADGSGVCQPVPIGTAVIMGEGRFELTVLPGLGRPR